ncbi:hypothetical protein F2Q68_00027222 [Brassica cretica]|uniref:Uncharacterized protein n=1 Tax=Brassica cretica TaxID=69181 RepID=A0A8S9IDY5_BRACR|nr:hypothetical protein F2Q68_00027222 [Brassica cretica]
MEPVGCVLRLMLIQLAVTIKLLIHLLRLFLLSREKYMYIVHTDPSSCNRQTSDTFASHVLLNATPVFRSTVQREKHCLLYEGVSTVPLNSLPDFSPVHIGLSPTTRGAGDIKATSKANSIASQIELLEEIIKAKGKFDFTAELEKLKEELMEAEGMLADVKVKVPDWYKLNEKWLLDE